MRPKFEKSITRAFHGALLTSLLTIAIPVVLSACFKPVTAIIWSVGYANLFVLWPLITILLIVLAILYLRRYGLSRGIEKMSVRILTLLLALFVIYSGTKELETRNNKLEVTFKNSTSVMVKHIRLFGRGALTSLDSLAPCSDTTLVFRGKSILRKTENNYENELTLLYYTNSHHFRRDVLRGFDRWRVLTGPVKLDFHGADSVEFSYLQEKQPS